MLYFSVLWMMNNTVEQLASKRITRPGVTICLHEMRLSVPWRNNFGRDLNNLPWGQRQLLLTAGGQQISTHRNQIATNVIVLQFQNQHKQSNKNKNKRQLLFFLIKKTNELAK